MTRSCAACGGSLDGMSSRAKYCSSTCRSRACEGRVIPLAQTGVVPVADETETEAAIDSYVEATAGIGTIGERLYLLDPDRDAGCSPRGWSRVDAVGVGDD